MKYSVEGLYDSLYGKAGSGGYEGLYRKEGAAATQRMDIRLGGFSAEEEDDDDEEEAPSVEAPTPSAAPKENFFSQEQMGFPNWLIGIFLLGFAYAYRRRKKAEAA